MLIDDLRTTLDGVKSPPDNRYLAWPIPSGVDNDIAGLIDQFVTGDAALREGLMWSLTSPQADTLICFGIRMAMLAVREQSVARLRVGLLAVALGGSSRQSDWRDVMGQMPPFEDAGMRIRDPPSSRRLRSPLATPCGRFVVLRHYGRPGSVGSSG